MNGHPDTLNRLVEELKHHFPDQVKRVVVFGSHARGEASSESDCLLVFAQVTPI